MWVIWTAPLLWALPTKCFWVGSEMTFFLIASMAFKGPFDQPPTPKPPLPLVPASDLRLDFLMSAVFFCTSTLSWLCSLCSFTTHWLSSYYETAISTYPGYWGFTDKQISILAFKEVEDSREM